MLCYDRLHTGVICAWMGVFLHRTASCMTGVCFFVAVRGVVVCMRVCSRTCTSHLASKNFWAVGNIAHNPVRPLQEISVIGLARFAHAHSRPLATSHVYLRLYALTARDRTPAHTHAPACPHAYSQTQLRAHSYTHVTYTPRVTASPPRVIAPSCGLARARMHNTMLRNVISSSTPSMRI